MENKPALLLLPNLLADLPHHQLFLPASVDAAVATLDGLIAESASGGRRFLSRFQTKKPTHLMPIAVYSGEADNDTLDFLLEPIRHDRQRWGFVSDAGLPCIADPGASLVRRARLLGIPLRAFVGPSSLMLALMLSGLPGQHFAFHGYINREPAERQREIAQLERQSLQNNATQIFIEAPHRSGEMLESLLATLAPATWLCAAIELTTQQQSVVSQPVALWKKSPLPNLQKKNAIFLLNGDGGLGRG
jgi:16S rRNA (cytidine1402-2'-O)-methyltransferase